METEDMVLVFFFKFLGYDSSGPPRSSGASSLEEDPSKKIPDSLFPFFQKKPLRSTMRLKSWICTMAKYDLGATRC